MIRKGCKIRVKRRIEIVCEVEEVFVENLVKESKVNFQQGKNLPKRVEKVLSETHKGN